MAYFYDMAHVAQLVEHVLGKDEVTRSIRVVGSTLDCASGHDAFRDNGARRERTLWFLAKELRYGEGEI